MFTMNQSEWTALGWLCLQDDSSRRNRTGQAPRADRNAARAARHAHAGSNRIKRDPMPRGKGRVDHDKSHIADKAS